MQEAYLETLIQVTLESWSNCAIRHSAGLILVPEI